MGCWNATCSVTNLPIFGEDDTVVLLFKDHPDREAYRSSCYPYFYHSILPLTFEGKYDDYGRVTECEGPTLNIIIDALKERLVVEDKSIEIDTEVLFDLDNSNDLKVEYFGARYIINTAFVLKEVYTDIVEKTKVPYWTPGKYEYFNINDVRKSYPQFMQDLKEFNSKIKADDPSTWLGRLDGRVGTTVAAELLSKSTTSGNDRSIPIIFPDTLTTFAETATDDQLLEVVDNAMQLHFFQTFYHDGRMMFHVPSGKGSQDSDTGYQELRARITLKQAKKIKKRWEE